MISKAYNESADVPRACRGYIRAIRLTLPIIISLSLALAPFSANLTNSGLCVEKSEAHAIAPVFAGALAFLEECAAAAGFATVGDFIATGAGVCAVGSGLTIGTAAGINLGNSASDNLNALIDTADYPAWESLDYSTRQSWGSEDNYNAAKYNSLMVTFGLGEDYEQYQQAWGAGTADGFSFSTTGQDNLEQLGRIGTNWINGTGNTLSDIVNSSFFNRSEILSWSPANNYKYVNPEGDANWPSGLTRTILYSEITAFNMRYKSGTTTQERNTTFNSPVYSFYWTEYLSNGLIGLYTVNFSKTSFTETLSNGRVQNSYSAMTEDRQIYYRTYSVQLINGMSDLEYINVAYIGDQTGVLSGSMPNYVIGNILYGESQVESNSVVDYPAQEVEDGELDDEVVYYPEDGINDDTSWEDFTTEPDEPEVRPSNVYNPDDLTGTQEWRDETESNVMPLTKIKFDKLFPFCLMTDVQNVTEKIEETITPGEQSNYLKIKIPMAYASDGEGGSVEEDIELDGTPVHDLLIMVRPFNQALLLFLMIFTLVMFWKSILTGD